MQDELTRIQVFSGYKVDDTQNMIHLKRWVPHDDFLIDFASAVDIGLQRNNVYWIP